MRAKAEEREFVITSVAIFFEERGLMVMMFIGFSNFHDAKGSDWGDGERSQVRVDPHGLDPN